MLFELFEKGLSIEELISYLSSSSPKSILNIGTVNWYFRLVITTSNHFRDFWTVLLYRTAHISLDHRTIRDCYPDCPVTVHSWLKGVRYQIRDEYGECQVTHHQRRKCKSCLFTTSKAYQEWRRVAYNRFMHQYWNHHKERKLLSLKYQIRMLENEKKFFDIVNERFDLLSNRRAPPLE